MYVIGGTRLVNYKAPYFKYAEGGIITQLLKPITIRLLDKRLRERFGKGVREFNKNYRILPMFAGTPMICASASSKSEALGKVDRDRNLIGYLLGLDLSLAFSARPYPY